MPKLLSQPAVEQYHRDGYFSPVRVMTPADARRFRSALETHEATIVDELNGVQGKPVTIGGYYHPDAALTSAAMRPSAISCWGRSPPRRPALAREAPLWKRPTTFPMTWSARRP